MNFTLRVPPLAVTVLAGLLGWAFAVAFPSFHWPCSGRVPLAVVFLVLGFTICLLGVASFRRARTTVNPLKPDTATSLVVCGIYRFTRNPMYLGFLLLLLGAIVWLANLVAFLAAVAFVLYLNRFQIVPEERALRERFGLDYSTYAARVRRWL